MEAQDPFSCKGVMDSLEFLSEYSHLGPASSCVGDALQEVRAYLQRSETGFFFEMEARLGTLSDRGFVSDVGQGTFTTLLTMLESYPRWHHVSGWVESQDVFYMIDLPTGPEGKVTQAEVRTTVGLDAEKKITLNHCIKRKLRVLDLRVVTLGSCNESSYLPALQETLNGPLNPRVSFSVEQSVPHELLPIAVVPTRVRIKQRKRFFITSLGVERPAFSVDMTIVYSGKSKSEAEQSQAAAKDAVYEVEVECLEPLAYLQSCNHQEQMLALSLLLKLHDFVSFLNPQTPITFARAR